jgi:hypothetical protein
VIAAGRHGAVTTHGGCTTSPIIDGDKVMLNALVLAGAISTAPATAFAFDKKTGRRWIARRRRATTTRTTDADRDHRRHAR